LAPPQGEKAEASAHPDLQGSAADDLEAANAWLRRFSLRIVSEQPPAATTPVANDAAEGTGNPEKKASASLGPPLVGLRPRPSKPAASDAWRGEERVGEQVAWAAVDWRPYVPAAHRAIVRLAHSLQRRGKRLDPPLDVVEFFLASAWRVLADERGPQ